MSSLGSNIYENDNLKLKMASEISHLCNSTQGGNISARGLAGKDVDPTLRGTSSTTLGRITMESLIEASRPVDQGVEPTSTCHSTPSHKSAMGFGKSRQHLPRSLPSRRLSSSPPALLSRRTLPTTGVTSDSFLLDSGTTSSGSSRANTEELLWRGLMEPRDGDLSTSTPAFTDPWEVARCGGRMKYEEVDPSLDGFAYSSLEHTPQTQLGDMNRERHLEKNRQAASRCRMRQKQKVEELERLAKESQWMNKLLMNEATKLRAELGILKNIAAEHSNCPDDRLAKYIQRVADRLVEPTDTVQTIEGHDSESKDVRENDNVHRVSTGEEVGYYSNS